MTGAPLIMWQTAADGKYSILKYYFKSVRLDLFESSLRWTDWQYVGISNLHDIFLLAGCDYRVSI